MRSRRFVSHSSHDKPKVEALAAALRDRGLPGDADAAVPTWSTARPSAPPPRCASSPPTPSSSACLSRPCASPTTGCQLPKLAARPDLPDRYRALVPVLQQIVAGSRDPTLASTAGPSYMDAVEVALLLERLG